MRLPASALPSLLALLLPSCGILSLSGEEQRAFDVHYQNAQYWYDAGDFNRALQQAHRAQALDDGNRELLLLLGWIHLKRGTRDDVYYAERYLEQVSGGGLFRGRWYKATLGLGLALRRQGDYLRETAERMDRDEIRPAASKDPKEEVARLRRRAEEKY